MKSQILSLVLVLAVCEAKAQAVSGQFEIVDLSGSISGEPQVSQDAARSSWNSACQEWKKETKELNRGNEMLSINCNVASCSFQDNGRTLCSSNGTYQIKTAGTRADNSNSSNSNSGSQGTVTVQQPQTQVVPVQTQVVYETYPAPRYGYVWVPGFWGWGHHHYRSWHGGYWRRHW